MDNVKVAQELERAARELTASDFKYYMFESRGELHRNVLLETLEEYGVTFRDYDTSTTGIKAKNSKTEKILQKLFKTKKASERKGAGSIGQTLKVAQELMKVAKELTASVVPDEWMDAFIDGASLFNREAKRRGYVTQRPGKFIGGVRFLLDSAGGKTGVQVVISVFYRIRGPWFVRMTGWMDGKMIRNVNIEVDEDLPTPREVAQVIGKAGDKAGFWGRR